MNTNERPTPETDAVTVNIQPEHASVICSTVPASFARCLERERDEARAKLAAMREAINEAHAALKASSDCWPVWSGTPSTFAAHQKQIAALATLQTFIGPAPAPATKGGAA